MQKKIAIHLETGTKVAVTDQEFVHGVHEWPVEGKVYKPMPKPNAKTEEVFDIENAGRLELLNKLRELGGSRVGIGNMHKLPMLKLHVRRLMEAQRAEGLRIEDIPEMQAQSLILKNGFVGSSKMEEVKEPLETFDTELENLKTLYEKLYDKKPKGKFANDKEWLKGKIEEAGQDGADDQQDGGTAEESSEEQSDTGSEAESEGTTADDVREGASGTGSAD